MGRERRRAGSQAALLSSVADAALAAPWYAWLGHIHARLGHHNHARQSVRRAIDEATRAADDATR